jgi:hypothetical protein
MWKRIFILILVFMILVGCGTQNTPTPSPSLTLLPTKTTTSALTFTPTITLTKTSTPVPTVTWTPLPTISPNDFSNIFLNLLNSNGGCELPCWLGITPGKTTTSESIQFFSQFPIEIGELRKRAIMTVTDFHLTSSYELSIVVNNNVITNARIYSIDEIVQSIFIRVENYRQNYQLKQILKSFGKPERIFINSQSSSQILELPPSVITLDYTEFGIWAFYGYTPKQIGENLVICPHLFDSNSSFPDMLGGRLELFSPEVPPSIHIEEYANMFGGFTAKNLEDVTNMNVEIFYNTFVNSNPESCLETPANLWP